MNSKVFFQRNGSKISLAVLLLFSFLFFTTKIAFAGDDWQIGPFVRPVDKPIIFPRLDTVFKCPMQDKPVYWESGSTFNPAAVVFNDKIYVLYRAEDGSGDGIGKYTSRVGLACSSDGISFERLSQPVLYPDQDSYKGYEWFGGCEDPRIVESSEGIFYMYYTMWNLGNPERKSKSARIGVASSRDLIHWKKHGPIFKEACNEKFLNRWHKSAAVVTSIQNNRLKAVKINGTYWMYWGEKKICAAISDDLINWKPVLDEYGNAKVLISPRAGRFDSMLTEVGPPAVLTEDGIVLLYNGKNKGCDKTIADNAYAAGQILIDSKDPVHLLSRCKDYFFKPEMEFEKTGQYKDGTVFVEGLVFYKNKWYLYYGTADSYVGVAVCRKDI